MTVKLPEPIRLYFESENTHGADALDRCFWSEAIVRDENQIMRGLPAIKSWREANAAKYAHTVVPLEIAIRDGKTVVSTQVTGNFPGSPVMLDHIFELAGERIVALEIR
jgi:hypothetical protein